jgi:hypothetical protein
MYYNNKCPFVRSWQLDTMWLTAKSILIDKACPKGWETYDSGQHWRHWRGLDPLSKHKENIYWVALFWLWKRCEKWGNLDLVNYATGCSGWGAVEASEGLGGSAQSVIVIRLYNARTELGLGRLTLWTVTKENRYEAWWFKQPQGCQENPFIDARPKVVFNFSPHPAMCCSLSTHVRFPMQ